MNTRALNCLLALTLGLAACSKHEPGPAAGEEKPTAEAGPRVEHGTNGEVTITLDAAAQKHMGLKVAVLASASVPQGIEAFGRVLDVSGLLSLVAELSTAEAASSASAAELQRVQILASQSNASERALESARAAALRDKTQLEATRLRLVSTWGKAIADQKDLSGFVQKISTLDRVLVEMNSMSSESADKTPSGARLVSLSRPGEAIPAAFLCPAPAVDRALQTRAFWFAVDPNKTALAPGAALSGFIEFSGEPRQGVKLPRSALLYHLGLSWVYVQREEKEFERVQIKPGQPLDNGWFVSEGLKPGDKVVVAGAQELLSQELGKETE